MYQLFHLLYSCPLIIGNANPKLEYLQELPIKLLSIIFNTCIAHISHFQRLYRLCTILLQKNSSFQYVISIDFQLFQSQGSSDLLMFYSDIDLSHSEYYVDQLYTLSYRRSVLLWLSVIQPCPSGSIGYSWLWNKGRTKKKQGTQ